MIWLLLRKFSKKKGIGLDVVRKKNSPVSSSWLDFQKNPGENIFSSNIELFVIPASLTPPGLAVAPGLLKRMPEFQVDH